MSKSIPLSQAQLGVAYQVTRIPRIKEQRKFFYDIGLIPNAVVTPMFRSPSQEPTAYRIKGITYALRCEHADQIYVRPLSMN